MIRAFSLHVQDLLHHHFFTHVGPKTRQIILESDTESYKLACCELQGKSKTAKIEGVPDLS